MTSGTRVNLLFIIFGGEVDNGPVSYPTGKKTSEEDIS